MYFFILYLVVGVLTAAVCSEHVPVFCKVPASPRPVPGQRDICRTGSKNLRNFPKSADFISVSSVEPASQRAICFDSHFSKRLKKKKYFLHVKLDFTTGSLAYQQQIAYLAPNPQFFLPVRTVYLLAINSI